jgi:hypothetical protein
MAQVSGHGHRNITHGTGVRTSKQDTWHRFQDMEIGYMVHVSKHGNRTHETGIRTWTQDT